MKRRALAAAALSLSLAAGAPAWKPALEIATPDGRERTALIHRPAGLDGPAPVVLALHGGGGSAAGFREDAGLDEVADREGFVVVYPEGISAGGGRLTPRLATWNAGACCGKAQEEGVDDVGFLAALVGELVESGVADPSRVYALGHSNGAQMSYRLACERPDLVAAIAPVGAQGVHGECAPGRAVPTLHIHGTADGCARWAGGECGGCFHEVVDALVPWPLRGQPDTWACSSVEAWVEEVAVRSGCTDRREEAAGERSWLHTWSGCADGSEVALLTEEGAGHAWPGGGWPDHCRRPRSRVCRVWKEKVGPLAEEVVASEAAWAFLSRFSLP